MKKALIFLAFLSVFILTKEAKADTIVTVKNGSGAYTSSYMHFYDENGTLVTLSYAAGTVTLQYKDGAIRTYPYTQTTNGLTVTGTWKGTDESNYEYTANVQENLVQTTKSSGSGRGGGYRPPTVVTSLQDGKIDYDYAGAYVAPLVPPILDGTATVNAITLTWNSPSGGVAPYSYTIYDENNYVVATTSDLTFTITGLNPLSTHTYSLLTTDSAGSEIYSKSFQIDTPAPTLNTIYTFSSNNTDGSIQATWTPEPSNIRYEIYYYDWPSSSWVKGAETTGNSATINNLNTELYNYYYVYIAGYDAAGIETDYDLQTVDVFPLPSTTERD